MQLEFTTSHINTKNSPLSTLNIVGDLTSRNIQATTLDNAQLFKSNPFKLSIDLTYLNDLDIGGINYLVKLKIMAMNLGVQFSIKAPYSQNIVDEFKKTKMEDTLNVSYMFSNTMAA